MKNSGVLKIVRLNRIVERWPCRRFDLQEFSKRESTKAQSAKLHEVSTGNWSRTVLLRKVVHSESREKTAGLVGGKCLVRPVGNKLYTPVREVRQWLREFAQEASDEQRFVGYFAIHWTASMMT